MEANGYALPLDLTANGPRQIESELVDCVRRARAGDDAAFALLVERHERMVFRTALRLLGRVDAAQDAMQEAFLRLHRYLRRFDESRELGPWLYRVVVNVCHDLGHRRPPGVHVALDQLKPSELPATAGGQEEVDAASSRDDDRRLIQAALLTLPNKERAAVVLRDIEGRATAEVARILGSSEGTVRSQISTARVKIKRFVEQARETRR
jgi:RNA polymerase sigma-70 factor (ECF subfamily)